MTNKISVRIDNDGLIEPIENAKINFGPNYFLDVMKDGWKVKLILKGKRQGIMIDATELDGDFDKSIDILNNRLKIETT